MIDADTYWPNLILNAGHVLTKKMFLVLGGGNLEGKGGKTMVPRLVRVWPLGNGDSCVKEDLRKIIVG